MQSRRSRKSIGSAANEGSGCGRPTAGTVSTQPVIVGGDGTCSFADSGLLDEPALEVGVV